MARAVIITGIPYPAATDPRVALKRAYLDDPSTGLSARASLRLTGSDWYAQQAARAVNQAVGRVIRHRYDFGALLFCDERFASPRVSASLPLWMRPYLAVFNTFGEVQGHMTRFFKNINNYPELIVRARARGGCKDSSFNAGFLARP